MSGFLERITDFLFDEEQALLDQDRALNALGGGKRTETISGTIGRAILQHVWWGPLAAWPVELVLGRGHCVRQAQTEAERRAKSGGPT
jgi:hypothetical protein